MAAGAGGRPPRVALFALLLVGVAAASVSLFGRVGDDAIHGCRYEGSCLAGRMGEIAGHLRAWHDARGRYPTTDEGLSVLGPVGEEVDFAPDPRHLDARPFLDGGRVVGGPVTLLRADIGPVTPWPLPYFYENRNGAPAGTFARSPVDEDESRRWSNAVADGVYVWCVDGRHLARRERALRVRQGAIAGAGLLLASAAAGLWWRARRRSGVRWSLTAGVACLLALLAAASVGPFLRSAAPRSHHTRFDLSRRPPIAAECEQVLAAYRDRGAIRPETHDRLVAGLRALGERIAPAGR